MRWAERLAKDARVRQGYGEQLARTATPHVAIDKFATALVSLRCRA
jgi:hypothetical protein